MTLQQGPTRPVLSFLGLGLILYASICCEIANAGKDELPTSRSSKLKTMANRLPAKTETATRGLESKKPTSSDPASAKTADSWYRDMVNRDKSSGSLVEESDEKMAKQNQAGDMSEMEERGPASVGIKERLINQLNEARRRYFEIRAQLEEFMEITTGKDLV